MKKSRSKYAHCRTCGRFNGHHPKCARYDPVQTVKANGDVYVYASREKKDCLGLCGQRTVRTDGYCLDCDENRLGEVIAEQMKHLPAWWKDDGDL